MPTTYGKCPLPRESHTGIHFTCNKSYKQFLLIYGGMNYQRLRDTWLLDIGKILLMFSLRFVKLSPV